MSVLCSPKALLHQHLTSLVALSNQGRGLPIHYEAPPTRLLLSLPQSPLWPRPHHEAMRERGQSTCRKARPPLGYDKDSMLCVCTCDVYMFLCHKTHMLPKRGIQLFSGITVYCFFRSLSLLS